MTTTIKQPIKCGRCGLCKWRGNDGYCKNTDKIDEDYGQGVGDDDDRLIYDYAESGGFYVGVNFGCVHFEEK
jgi:hypothetical protein